jgi:hypothetical protein
MAASGLICVLCILGAGVAGSDSTIAECRVADMVRYCGNGDFICKVDDVPKLDGIQVRVKTRGVLPAEDPAKVKDAEDVVAADLANAGRIILKHVRMRNYFRMEADVEVDGRSLADTLVAKGAARPEPQQKPLIEAPAPAPAGTTLAAGERAMLHAKVPQTVRPAAEPRPDTRIALRGTSDVSHIREDTTFADALEIIRHAVEPPLPMVVMWKDIEENAFVERTTPVGIDGLGATTLGQALKLVLLGVSSKGAELEYVVEGGLITIASKAMGLGQRRYTRAYDVGEVLASPAGLSGMGGMYGGMGGMYGQMGNMGTMGGGGMFGNMGNTGSYGNMGTFGNSGGAYRNPGLNRGLNTNRRPGGGMR